MTASVLFRSSLCFALLRFASLARQTQKQAPPNSKTSPAKLKNKPRQPMGPLVGPLLAPIAPSLANVAPLIDWPSIFTKRELVHVQADLRGNR